MLLPPVPDLTHEKQLIERGYPIICGVDEAGRGPLAGPVTAAAVILDHNNIPDGLNDSKKLNAAKRDQLFDEILGAATVGIAQISARHIDQINIRAASLLAMTRAVQALSTVPNHALIDGNALPQHLPCDATALVKGDAKSLTISAASIVAKVMRDRLMERAEKYYPGYGIGGHKGYPTKKHREAVAELGPSRLHRHTFAPVAAAIKLLST